MMKLVCLISIKLKNGNTLDKWIYDRVDTCYPKDRKWFASLVDLQIFDAKERYEIAGKLVNEDLGYWLESEEAFSNLLRSDKNSEVVLLNKLGLISSCGHSLSITYFND